MSDHTWFAINYAIARENDACWTAGTWAEVAIGDTVLGGDGYVWRVTEG
jgi:hypothetical protein